MIRVLPAITGKIGKILYSYGSRSAAWVQGYAIGNANTFNKAAERIELAAYSGLDGEDFPPPAEITAVTDNVVSLTPYSNLMILINRPDSDSEYRERFFIVSTSKTGGYGTYNLRESVVGGTGLLAVNLDVSGLTGNYYVRVHAKSPGKISTGIHILKVYLT